jgi:hypothetical protein
MSWFWDERRVARTETQVRALEIAVTALEDRLSEIEPVITEVRQLLEDLVADKEPGPEPPRPETTSGLPFEVEQAIASVSFTPFAARLSRQYAINKLLPDRSNQRAVIAAILAGENSG